MICLSNSTKLLWPNGADRRLEMWVKCFINTYHVLTHVCMCMSVRQEQRNFCENTTIKVRGRIWAGHSKQQALDQSQNSIDVWSDQVTVLMLLMRCLFGVLTVPPDLYFTYISLHTTHFQKTFKTKLGNFPKLAPTFSPISLLLENYFHKSQRKTKLNFLHHHINTTAI